MNSTSVGRHRLLYLLGLGLLLATAGLSIVAIVSIIAQLFWMRNDVIYALAGDATAAQERAASTVPDFRYLNVAVVDLDEAKGMATLNVYGSRPCPTTCPKIVVQLFSLSSSVAESIGMPPVSTATGLADAQEIDATVTVPVRGQPLLYPYDAYELILAVAVQEEQADGKFAPLPTEGVDAYYLTLESRLSRLTTSRPVLLDPTTTRTPVDPSSLLYVSQIRFDRPLYLKVLTVLLVELIAVASIYAVLMRSTVEVMAGIGGLILGVWSIRSVLVPGAISFVTLVDLLLSAVILILLGGIMVRAVLDLRRVSRQAQEDALPGAADADSTPCVGARPIADKG